MKFDTLKEAYKEALIKSEGYKSDMRIPIFKNTDGTFEIGGAQHFQWSDISDGTFTEIGSVDGWFFDDEDNGINRDSQIKEFIEGYLEEGYELFLGQLEEI